MESESANVMLKVRHIALTGMSLRTVAKEALNEMPRSRANDLIRLAKDFALAANSC